MTSVFNPNMFLQNIYLVGCGGTGAHTARILARMLYDMKRRNLQVPHLTLIDPDVVEEKNVGRQLFTAADAYQGLYKAEVVGSRLNAALGLNIQWITEPLSAEHTTQSLSDLVISCVDNHEPRIVMHELPGLLIGAGNFKDGGQVVIGNTANEIRMADEMKRDDAQYRVLPKEGMLFPSLLEPDTSPQPALSCAELVMEDSQALLINDWMAQVIGQYLYLLLYRKPISTFITFVSLDGLTVKSTPISRENLSAYLNP